MANQRDVALLAGVSSATVSRYLNSPQLVSPDAAQRIAQAIDALKYKVDYYAQSLKTGHSNHIAILTPGSGPFYWQIFFVLQRQLAALGYYVTIFSTRDISPDFPNSRRQILSTLRSKQLEGVIFFPLCNDDDDAMLDFLYQQHENVVIVDRVLNDNRFHQVAIDNFGAGMEAADDFIGHGHRSMLVLYGIDSFFSARQRLAGFQEACKARNIHLGPDRILPAAFSADLAYQKARAFLAERRDFTAVFAENDAMALGFMRAAAEHGLHCPLDYSIIGFDNSLDFAPYLEPGLSSFDQHLNEVGEVAAKALSSLIENGEKPGDGPVMIRPSLIRRESVAGVKAGFPAAVKL